MNEKWSLVIAGSASIVCAGCLYVLKNKLNHIRTISQCKNFQSVSKLLDYMAANGINSLDIVSITGRVTSDGDPIGSKYLGDVVGVMCEQSIVEHKLSWSYLNQKWSDEECIISFFSKQVPFSLSDGIETIKVHSPLLSVETPLQLVYDKFEPKSENNILNHIYNFAVGSETKGFQYLEKILPVRTILTAVGAVKKEGGELSISPPKQLPYILSRKSLSEICDDLRQQTFLPKVFIVISGTVVSITLSHLLYKRWQEFARKRRSAALRRQVEEQRAAAGTGGGGGGDVTQEACVVCLDNPRGTVLIPCGHVCMCIVCSDGMEMCPVCRTRVDRIIRTYHS